MPVSLASPRRRRHRRRKGSRLFETSSPRALRSLASATRKLIPLSCVTSWRSRKGERRRQDDDNFLQYFRERYVEAYRSPLTLIHFRTNSRGSRVRATNRDSGLFQINSRLPCCRIGNSTDYCIGQIVHVCVDMSGNTHHAHSTLCSGLFPQHLACPGRGFDRDIPSMLYIATSAPSSFNIQPWSVVLVRDAATRKKLSTTMLGGNTKKVLAAPVTAVFCADLGEGFSSSFRSSALHFSSTTLMFDILPPPSLEFLLLILLCDHHEKLNERDTDTCC